MGILKFFSHLIKPCAHIINGGLGRIVFGNKKIKRYLHNAMKTLLVPTDFSKCAEYALDYACFIAEKTNSKIILLHVLPPVDTETSYSPGGEWMGGSWAGETDLPGTPLMMALLKETRKKINRAMDIAACKGIVMQWDRNAGCA
jgi:hypothetical protein